MYTCLVITDTSPEHGHVVHWTGEFDRLSLQERFDIVRSVGEECIQVS